MVSYEYKKIKHAFLPALILISLGGPIAMITVMYINIDNKTFFEVVSSNSVYVQLIPFSASVIFGCYIVAREYKDNMMTYLKITPLSQIRIMLSKLVVITFELCFTQIFTFILLFVINTVAGGYDTDLLLKYIEAGLISAGALSCLVPLIIYISYVRRSFSSAALIFLVVFMLTFPYMLSGNGYLFPHLLPMLLVAKHLGKTVSDHVNIYSGALILIAMALIFLYMSIVKIKKKE